MKAHKQSSSEVIKGNKNVLMFSGNSELSSVKWEDFIKYEIELG